MNINRYHYPHPVLGKETDFPDAYLLVDFKVEKKEDNHFAVSCKVDYNDQTIKELIVDETAELVCEVNCSSTFYRNCYHAKMKATELIDFTIEDGLLRGQVEFLFLIVAKSDILDYKPNVNKDVLRDKKFWIQKGELLGFLGNYKKNIDLSGETFKDYIIIIPSDTIESVGYDYNDEQIKVLIPKEYYSKLDTMKRDKNFRSILISTHIAPAIQNALYHFLPGHENNFNHNEKQWYMFLKDQILNYTKTDDAYIDKDDIVTLTELILKDQSLNVIDILEEVFNEINEIENND